MGNVHNYNGATYTYGDAAHKQAVTAITDGHSFTYDANGNMTSRTDTTGSYTQVFDVENRLTSVTKAGVGTTTFAYDAAGQRVKTMKPDGTILYTPFPQFEEELRPLPPPTPTPTHTPTNTPIPTATGTPGIMPTATPCWFNCNSTYSMGGEPMSGGSGYDVIQRSRYSLAGQTIAIRVTSSDANDSNTGLFYYLTDHLGSTSVLMTSSNGLKGGSTARYHPFGSYRTTPTQTISDRHYTGHAHNDDLGLVYMNARYYVSSIGRFASADVIVPDGKDPQAHNRYSYVRNNPLILHDPSGHCWAFAQGVRNTSLGASICGRLDMFKPTAGPRLDARTATTAPDNNDMTAWLVDQMVTNASHDALVIREHLHSLHPARMAAAAQVFTSLVQTGGSWDFKVDILDEGIQRGAEQLVRLGNQDLNYQAVANIHYGFVGRAAGFGPGALLLGAGWDQIDDHDTGFVWSRAPYYGDQAFDYWNVQFGIFLYDQYGHRLQDLSPEAFAQAFDQYILLFGQPPALD